MRKFYLRTILATFIFGLMLAIPTTPNIFSTPDPTVTTITIRTASTRTPISPSPAERSLELVENDLIEMAVTFNKFNILEPTSDGTLLVESSIKNLTQYTLVYFEFLFEDKITREKRYFSTDEKIPAGAKSGLMSAIAPSSSLAEDINPLIAYFQVRLTSNLVVGAYYDYQLKEFGFYE